jgi:MFS family permease
MTETAMPATDGSTAEVPGTLDPKRDRLVIVASSLGTVFEWYDFFLYGILAGLLGKLFFPSDNATAATLASLAAFGAGFGVRPFGALVFGYFGDLIGRKYTFLVTITLMGGATAAIGFLPTYAQAGIWAPVLLVGLRLLQGLALGGEYGGAAIYVAEHAPPNKRGQYTSWIQVSVAGGFLLCLIVVLGCRHAMTTAEFEAWGWRIPFLASLLMLAISLYIRMKLSESPVFKAMKAAGTTSKNPIVDSWNHPGNKGRILTALFGVGAGLTVVYYTSQFYTLYFLQGTARVAEEEALLYMAVGAIIAAPFYVLCGALSDRIGRKRLLLVGYALSAIFTFPLFHMMADAANPALARATATAPVRLELPACDFSIFANKQESECGKALAFLAKRGISYAKVAPYEAGHVAINVGTQRIAGFDDKAYTAALVAAGYPDKADPAQKQPWKIILAIALLIGLSAMTYGQVAAILVEMFPARIRYTSMSIPYHIGTGYFGGFLPFISQYIVVSTGDAYAGLWYTVVVVIMAFIVSLLFLPGTYGQPLDDDA